MNSTLPRENSIEENNFSESLAPVFHSLIKTARGAVWKNRGAERVFLFGGYERCYRFRCLCFCLVVVGFRSLLSDTESGIVPQRLFGSLGSLSLFLLRIPLVWWCQGGGQCTRELMMPMLQPDMPMSPRALWWLRSGAAGAEMVLNRVWHHLCTCWRGFAASTHLVGAVPAFVPPMVNRGQSR